MDSFPLAERNCPLSAAIVQVIGGGLAGPEAAWQLAQAGVRVRLYEMRPHVSTPAHKTGALGELVCSNSLKSDTEFTAPWLLKQELRRGGSLLLHCARAAAVPGGQALTVDREGFSRAIEAALLAHPLIELVRREVTDLAGEPATGNEAAPRGLIVLASGPLTSGPLSQELTRYTGQDALFFYDAISPIVDADSLDRARIFPASRYGKGGDDYLNCPLDRDEYNRFYDALTAAESYPLHSFEEPRFFEACLPLEELARRGRETLRFGPMKPVGLLDPHTGRTPYACVQLRQENLRADSYNLVGFQNHLRFGEQARVLRLIPGLERAAFLRFGQVHRNTYVQAPRVLKPALRLAGAPRVFLAGQLCGTEGYVEAIATGWLAGRFAAAAALEQDLPLPPRETALGSLLNYIHGGALEPDANAEAPPRRAAHYVPANMTFDLLPPPTDAIRRLRDKAARHRFQCERALSAFDAWQAQPSAAAAR